MSPAGRFTCSRRFLLTFDHESPKSTGQKRTFLQMISTGAGKSFNWITRLAMLNKILEKPFYSSSFLKWLAVILTSAFFIRAINIRYFEKDGENLQPSQPRKRANGVELPRKADAEEDIETPGMTEADQRRSNRVQVDLPGFGAVIGTTEVTPTGETYFAFRGIPYSKAGRFEEFSPPEPWKDPLIATDFGPNCPTPSQAKGDESEDCLFINVYTSNLASNKSAAVLAIIHPGGFLWGNGRLDPVYFMKFNIVVVTFNYRLGPLGFLYTPALEANLTGSNYGLKDQIHALRWIQRTIRAFGGDPWNVTAMGISAGAASVHLLMLAKHETEGLFQKAITLSGSALSPWAVSHGNPHEKFARYAKAVGCLKGHVNLSIAVGEETYKCIRERDYWALSKTWMPHFMVLAGQPFTMTPVVDGELIRDDPLSLLRTGNFLPIPWLASAAKDEGSMILSNSVASKDVLNYLDGHWLFICRKVLEMDPLSELEAAEACRSARQHYLGSENITYDTIYELVQFANMEYTFHPWQLVKLAGDRLINLPLQRSGQYHSRFAPFFGFRFDYQSPVRGFVANAYTRLPPKAVPKLHSWIPHAEHYFQLLKQDHQTAITSGDPDEFVHNFLVGVHWNFISTGKPTIPDYLGYDLQWPTFSEDLPRIQIVDGHPRVEVYYTQPHHVAFWESIGM